MSICTCPLRLAKLTKLSTDNGLFEIKTGVKLGKEYVVDLTTIGQSDFFNVEKEVQHTCATIHLFDTARKVWCPFPMEMLEIQGYDYNNDHTERKAELQ